MTLAGRHFEVNQWTDYVRKLVSSELQEQMYAHLQDGCPKCRQKHDLLLRLAVVCVREAAYYDLPRDVEQQVDALASRNEAPRRPVLERIWATLVYDSLDYPQPVGVRGGHQIDRQARFFAGDFSVDLRFEHEKGSASMVLVGQIANQKSPENKLANVPVILLAGSREVVRSMSNAFGEFQMMYVPEKDLRLLVPLESRGQELEVQLGRAQLL